LYSSISTVYVITAPHCGAHMEGRKVRSGGPPEIDRGDESLDGTKADCNRTVS